MISEHLFPEKIKPSKQNKQNTTPVIQKATVKYSFGYMRRLKTEIVINVQGAYDLEESCRIKDTR